MSAKTAVIIGAGPAGLTAASELLDHTEIKPLIFEMTGSIGGISQTVNYKGNRIDIGGHRFFSKSDRVMAWWKKVMPLQGKPSRDDANLGRTSTLSDGPSAPDPDKTDLVMLVRNRISRIFFLRSFFDYPISLKWSTMRNLGFFRLLRIGMSYCKVCLFPVKNIASLEDFLISRFGRELYLTFFKDYTEKVWGVECGAIKPDWGAQRIKGLSIGKTILHALKKLASGRGAIEQKEVETSLIEQFMYPKLGPGQLWEEVARKVTEKGGEINLNSEVVGVEVDGNRIVAAVVRNTASGVKRRIECDYLFSTMPVKDFIASLSPAAPPYVSEVAEGLKYRDFITVGLLLKSLRIRNETTVPTVNGIVPDNWIYIQERDVRLGRLQVFNNWSPYMVKDPDTVWVGLEYFCNEGDELWSRSDDDFIRFATAELERIGVIAAEDVIDSTILRMPKTYPAYFGTYENFDVIRRYVDDVENLYLIGRNGMHRYNNADHSMLTAMVAVENIINGRTSKDNLWAINTEEEYHEQKQERGNE